MHSDHVPLPGAALQATVVCGCSAHYDAVASAPWPCVHEASGAYQPRHPERTTLYRLLEEHFEDYLRCHEERFEPRDGYLRPHVRKVVEQYLECGRLHQGFARIRCGDCGDEKLLAFSCQTRNLCPSCQAKRAALFGMKLAEEILPAVPHTHVIFTIPRALRALFQRDRRLLGILSRAAYAALREVMQSALGRTDIVPGFVASLQTFGAFANWQPHIHGLVSEGAFTRDGDFVTLWNLDTDAVEAKFREHVLRELQHADRLSEEFADKLRAWSPSGFDVFAGRQVSMGETKRIEELGRYMTRPPMPQNLVEIMPDGRVLIPTPLDPKTGATEITLDPLELVHRIVMQIPDRGSHCVRYYGAYSCKARRARAEQPLESQSEESPTPETAPSPTSQPAADPADDDVDERARERRRTWARMLRHIFEVDPLVCAKCGGQMRVISVINDPAVVQRILNHLEGKEARAGPDPP